MSAKVPAGCAPKVHIRPSAIRIRKLEFEPTQDQDSSPVEQMRPRITDFFHALKLNCRLPEQAALTTSTLRDLDGNSAAIDHHVGKGQWSLVVIWASSCHICASEIPRYGAYYASAPDPKFSIIGVALDGYARKGAIVETMARWNMGFPSLVAERPALTWTGGEMRKVSLYGTPTFMLFDPSGGLKKLNLGPVWISQLEAFIRDCGIR